MPIYSRRVLRQSLGQNYLRDTLVGTTTGSWGTSGSLNIIDSTQADPTATDEQLYQRSTMRLLGSAGWIQDARIGSFNCASGAFLSHRAAATTIFSGMPFEVHSLITPAEKDRVLDLVIKDVRVSREVTLWTIDQCKIYSIGPDIHDIEDVRYYSNPTASLQRGEGRFAWFGFFNTASGVELRVEPALPASYQIAIEAIVDVSLGASDLATVNLPNDDLILWGAAARCYWIAEQNSPVQETTTLKARRLEAAKAYTAMSSRWQPKISRRIQFNRVY